MRPRRLTQQDEHGQPSSERSCCAGEHNQAKARKKRAIEEQADFALLMDRESFRDGRVMQVRLACQ
jgi:hypothetical protein